MGLEKSWFIAALSKDLTDRPLATSVLGRPLVLFRNRAGEAAALEDRCPHRNVALSLGTVRQGALKCAYHGWTFDERGACIDAPCKGPGETLNGRQVPSFPLVERDGTIWVALAEASSAEVPRWPCSAEPGYASFELVNRVRCPMGWVLENFVDCGHTGFVHAGLFRGPPKKLVRARLEETLTGVRIETFGESDNTSLLGRLLVPGGEAIRHTDEFIAPHTIRVDYHFGARHIVTTSICTPEDDRTTRITTRVSVRFPPVSQAVVPLLKRLTQRIILQDKVVLESQAECIAQFGGPRFSSMDADAPTAWVARALKAYEKGLAAPAERRTKEVEYVL